MELHLSAHVCLIVNLSLETAVRIVWLLNVLVCKRSPLCLPCYVIHLEFGLSCLEIKVYTVSTPLSRVGHHHKIAILFLIIRQITYTRSVLSCFNYFERLRFLSLQKPFLSNIVMFNVYLPANFLTIPRCWLLSLLQDDKYFIDKKQIENVSMAILLSELQLIFI